jgi:RNA polymerase subunit RPABC4/transcription elongation factor Spt4
MKEILCPHCHNFVNANLIECPNCHGFLDEDMEMI